MSQPVPDEGAIFWNRCRFDPSRVGGHYESYFLRGNHPDRPLAFWVRYTIFAPRQRYDDALGELWAIWFDGERNRIHAAKNEYPLSSSRFGMEQLDVRVGEATLTGDKLEGSAGTPPLSWSIHYQGRESPLLLLPRALYERSFPKAKAVVSAPQVSFTGTFAVAGETTSVDGWIGSQNHNWGSRHTDEYAWGQVIGFDNAPDAVLECSTARLRLGPLWTPWMTLIVLRLDGEEIRLNTMWQALRARQRVRFFDWHLASQAGGTRVRGRIHAAASSFVALPYYNPPGGTKTCLNSKLAACTLTIEQPGRAVRTLRSRQRAAFEILTDRNDHGLNFVQF